MFEDVRWAWEGYSWLSKARWVVPFVGPLRIQMSEVVAWLDVHGVAGERRSEFAWLVGVLEDAFMGFDAERRRADDAARAVR